MVWRSFRSVHIHLSYNRLKIINFTISWKIEKKRGGYPHKMADYSMMKKDNQNLLSLFKIYRSQAFCWYWYHPDRPINTRAISFWKTPIFATLSEITASPIINKWAFFRFSRSFTRKRECSLAILFHVLIAYDHSYLQEKFEQNPSSSFWVTER